jgi:hypothetical protein
MYKAQQLIIAAEASVVLLHRLTHGFVMIYKNAGQLRWSGLVRVKNRNNWLGLHGQSKVKNTLLSAGKQRKQYEAEHETFFVRPAVGSAADVFLL